MKTNMILNTERHDTELKFDKNSFHHSVLGFSLFMNEDTNGVSERDENISTTTNNIIHMKRFCINGSIVKGTRRPFLNSFGFCVGPGHKVLSEQNLFSKKSEQRFSN